MLAHRIVWCAALLALLLTFQRRWPEVGSVGRSPRVALVLLATTVLLGTNLLVYIWAVATERVLQASLGYFINPLVSVLLGMLFLAERLSRAQWWSLALAAAGVLVLVARAGELPWIALVLAITFGFYGLLRKQVRAEPEVGLLVETSLMSTAALVYLLGAAAGGSGAFGRFGPRMDLLLVAAGLITAVPLVLFTHGARRLPLSTVGFLQYMAPSIQFLLAVFVFREPFGRLDMAAFGLIWAGLVLYSWDSRRRWGKGAVRG